MYGVTWPWPRPLLEFFSGVMSRLPLGARMQNLKFVTLAILELLPFNARKLRGHVTLSTPLFENFLQVWCRDCQTIGALTPNLKSVALALTEILAFNAKILLGHVTLTTTPFYLLLTIVDWRPPIDVVWTTNRSSLEDSPVTSFLVVNVSAKFQREHRKRERQMREG